MPAHTGKKDAARSLYAQGVSLTAITKKLGIGRTTVTDYKKQDKGTERDWDKHRADLKGKTPPPKPNLVTFERPRGDKAKAAAVAPVLDGLDRSQLVDKIIGSTARLIELSDIPPGLGSALNGLATLIKLEKELKPATAAELAQQAMALGIKPGEFMQQLREAWERAG